MKKMKIEIWSDTACPFCYIGLKKLKDVVNNFEHKDKIEFIWHSYELNPKLPHEASKTSFYQYMAEMKGATVDQAKEDMEQMTALAKDVGLNFRFDRLVVANTSFALRLVKLANQHNLATEAEDALFKAYFSDGKDVSNFETLIGIGKSIGLDEKEVENMLKSNLFAEDVIKDTKFGDEELQLEYIPYYLFNGEHIIQGSVTPEEYKTVLEKSFKEWQDRGEASQRGETISGQSCSIDGVCS